MPGASPETIKAAYAALARRYHPDRNHDSGAGERMQRINEAYAVLSVSYRRRGYDLERFKAAQPVFSPLSEQLDAVGVQLPADAAPRLAQEHAARRLRPSTLISGLRIWSSGTIQLVRRHPAWAGAGALGGSAAIVVLLVSSGMILGSSGAHPTPTVAAPGPGVRVVAATTPLPPPQAATQPPATSPVAASPVAHADDVLFVLAQRFPPIDGLAEASRKPPGADHGWAFEADGCMVFAGEYAAADRADSARRYWSQQNGRYAYEGSGPVVAAVGDCDSQQHQFELLNAIADAFARPH